MSVKITYFVHTVSTDNEKKIATGWLPGKASENGLEKAYELKKTLDTLEFDAVFSSDLFRAVESAGIFFGDRYDVIHDERIRECNYGDQNGGPASAVKADMAQRVSEPYPNGESYQDVQVRIQDFCDYLKENYEGKSVAWVAHQAPQLALDVIMGGKTWGQAIDEDWRASQAFQPKGWEYTI